MYGINQNSAIISLNNSLVPGPSLIDGRTEQDRLHFLSQFASLINFYGQNNTIHGNWSPFLLKDPVILLSSISKTRFTELHSLYLSTCHSLDRLINRDKLFHPISNCFNQLFDQLTSVFRHIERWTHYMLQSDHIYSLKTYVIDRVQAHFSNYLWAIVWFQEQLYAAKTIPGIDSVDPFAFASFDKTTWRQGVDSGLFKQILQLQHTIDKSTPRQLFQSLTIVGDELFEFFHEIITHAAKELNDPAIQKSKFPDTTLIRAFVNLLMIHQEQLNGIAQKHLQFYYRDILKQVERTAVPDTVFLYAQLAKKNAAFDLPMGTLLNAGIDAQNNPALFASIEKVSLNPATIVSAYTLVRVPNNNYYSLHLQKLSDVGTIQTDEDGNIQSWPTFGKKTVGTDTLAPTGIALASPLLFLCEGQRNITLTLTFLKAIDQKLLQDADLYLSTQADWLPVKLFTTFGFDAALPNQAILNIALDPTQPAITAFLKNPDGFSSNWPLFKMSFPHVKDTADPPELKTLKIDVHVFGVKNFQFYNDYGTLSSKAPFQLFGPTPLTGSNFIIGNNELFSKPLTAFSLELDWDALPEKGFTDYYQAYNVFMYPIVPPVKRWLKRLFCKLRAKLFPKHPCKSTPIPVRELPFNNTAFTTNFQLLQHRSWTDIKMIKQESCDQQNTTINCTPYAINPTCPDQVSDTSNLLFSTDWTTCALTSSSVFSYGTGTQMPVINGDPEIQNSIFKYTDDSTSGFMKMQLSGPAAYGFGSALYPNVVADIALKNAEMISTAKKGDTIVPILPASLPFVPKVKGLSVNYSASQTYMLNFSSGDYPVQFFSYSPFKNYLSYDNSIPTADYWTGISTPIAGQKPPLGVPLYPAFNYDGALFMEIENLIAPNELSLYFELSEKAVSTTSATKVDYFSLSAGWEKLQVLSDGTTNFSCSGIIKIDIHETPATAHITMPGENNWIAIAMQGNPDAISQTVLLQPNGFKAQRSGMNYLSDFEAPQLAAGSITKTDTSVPQIATIVQPFPSFGGKPAENAVNMNKRISNRLKTKDRAVSSEDYFRLIQQEFTDIYYSRTVYDPVSKLTNVYVVKSVENRNDANAFLPMTSRCRQEEIHQFLTTRSSVFSTISVSNFEFEYVRITASVTVKTGYECQGTQKKIVQALSMLLSPWIADSGMQLTIDQGISEVQVTACIQSITGVATVESVFFDAWTIDPKTGDKIPCAVSGPTVIPATSSILLVSAVNHDITCIPVS